MSILDSFLAPRSVAIVGASSHPQKIGAVPVRYLLQHGYQGRIFPIHPSAESISGLPAFKNIASIKDSVDLAIFAIPAQYVAAALEDAISAGVRNIVMFSAGFAELGWAGEQEQAQIIRRANEAGIRILGPNCLGFMNQQQGVFATFSPVVDGGLAPIGNIGMVCQSGAFGAYAYAMARARGVGLSTWVTTGNEADISVADCIAWMAADERTRVIMAYMEGCQDGATLRAALQAARLAGKPVVMVKVGRTALGALTAASHTAALAGEDKVYDALFAQYGVWRANSIEEFFDIAHGLSVAGLAVNDKLGLLTVSGGVGVMMADDAAQAGLQVAPVPEVLQQQIKALIPFASTHNPVDLTGQVTADPSLLDQVARLLLGQGEYGMLLVFLSAFGMNEAMQKKQLELAQAWRQDYPDRLIIFSTLNESELSTRLESVGALSFADPARAIRLMSALSFFLRSFAQPIPVELSQPQRIAIAPGLYNELQAMQIVSAAGLPTPSSRAVYSPEAACVAAQELHYPVVMKVLSDTIVHKTEVHGVQLNLSDEPALLAAYQKICQGVKAAGVQDQMQGVLVTSMCAQGLEMIIGVRRDPQLGYVVMLGLGGTQVEILQDIVLRLAPIGMDQAHEMIQELRSIELLQGFRGKPKADIDALARALVQLSSLVAGGDEVVESLEINPLMVYPEGLGVMALDAVLLTRDEDSKASVDLKQRVIQTLPLFEMARMRAANTARRHFQQGFAGSSADTSMRWVNQFTHTRRLRSPADKEVVTPNNDTLFTNAWLDLSEGPLLIHVPDMGERYWVLGFLDAWTNPWAYAGRRTTGGQAQTLFVHAPDWQGDIPSGCHVIAAPSPDVWLIGRILVDVDPHDIEQVHALQDQFSITRTDGSAALQRVDALFSTRKADTPDASEYLRVLEHMLPRNPAQPSLLDWPPKPERLQPVLNEVYAELRDVDHAAELGGGWTTALKVRDSFGHDFLTRARVARNWIGTLGIEEAMYVMAEVDEHGQELMAGRAYELYFPATSLPDVGAFWSITLYGRSDCLLVSNPIMRHSIGDRTPGLRYDAEGGIRIHIQATRPTDEVNWLPAPEDDGFYLVLRLYQPAQSHLTGTYAYPALRCLPLASEGK